jgi:hypothetical protein
MIHLWAILALRVNALLGSKLAKPLNGSDMVQIITCWRQVQQESLNANSENSSK